jgi:hypothetical protein
VNLLALFEPLIGAAQLAVGRREGMERFGSSPQAFLSSLAPLVAFPIVGALALLISGSGAEAITTLLLTVVAQLAPAVLSHAVAARWGREAEWLRYATAFNWCQWAIPLVAVVLLAVLQVAGSAGVSDAAGASILVVALALYGIWLHWTLARTGLQLGRVRSIVLVVLVNAGTVALVLGPRLLAMLLQGDANGSVT